MRRRLWLGGLCAASVLAAPGVLAFTSAPAAGAATATYQQTLGGPGAAAVYPGGVEVVPAGAPNAGDIVVADTGNNQVAEYTPGGTQVWRVGSEGSSASLRVGPVPAAARRRASTPRATSTWPTTATAAWSS